MKINHVHGNLRIKIIKLSSYLLSKILFIGFKLFCPNIEYKSNDILISRATYAPWKMNRDYEKYYQKIKDLTLLDHPRLFTFYYLCSQVKNINAEILDIGCMKGGVGILLSSNNNKGRTVLIDTFDGFLDKEDLHSGEVFKYKGMEELKLTIKKLKLKNTFVYKKYFPKNVNDIKIRKIKLCHIDVNTYHSTKKSFDYVKNKIVKNGYIVFDDYGMYGVEKVTDLINKILKKDSQKFTFIFNYFGQCILVKK